MDVEKKRAHEVKTVDEMIRLYCRGNHHEREEGADLCPSCKELADYARLRTEKCPRMAEKTFCSQCPIHCYKKDMVAKIVDVMRYSGTRLMLRHPAMTIYHAYCTFCGKAANS